MSQWGPASVIAFLRQGIRAALARYGHHAMSGQEPDSSGSKYISVNCCWESIWKQSEFVYVAGQLSFNPGCALPAGHSRCHLVMRLQASV